MPADTPVVRLMSILAEGVVWGMNIILYIGCIYVLWTRRKDTKASWFLMGVTSVLFAIGVVHLGANVAGVLQAFIYNSVVATPAQAAADFYANRTVLPSRIGDTMFGMTGFIADVILIWRLWVVWGRNNLIVVFPIMMYIAGLICGIASIYVFWHLASGGTIFVIALIQWANALWAIQLATNVIVTSLIAGRIYYICNSANSMDRDAYGALSAIIESGALYSLGLIFQLAFFQVENSEAGSLVGDVTAQIAVLAPTLIVARVGLRLVPKGGRSTMMESVLRFAKPSTNGTFGSHTVAARYDVEMSTKVEGPDSDKHIRSFHEP